MIAQSKQDEVFQICEHGTDCSKCYGPTLKAKLKPNEQGYTHGFVCPNCNPECMGLLTIAQLKMLMHDIALHAVWMAEINGEAK